MTTGKTININSPMSVMSMSWAVCVGYMFLLFLPGLVGEMVDSLGFTFEEAGYVASAHLGGMMIGALIATGLVARINMRTGLFLALVGLVSLEVASSFVGSAALMIGVRVATGICCGFATGMGAACISSTKNPERVFALMVMAQFAMGCIGLFGMPYIGLKAGFFALATLGISVIATLEWFPSKIEDEAVEGEAPVERASLMSMPVIITLLSLFLFYVFNNSIWTYLDRIGTAANIAIETIGMGLGLSMLAGMLGGIMAFVIGGKFGLLTPLAVGLGAMTWGAWVIMGSFSMTIYFVSTAVFNAALAVNIAYYMGYCAALDHSGRTVVLANFVIAAGLAVGPILGAELVSDTGFDKLLLVSAVGFVGCWALMALGVMGNRKKSAVAGS